MPLILAITLTILAALWRWADGRGIPPKTTVRNGIGLAVAVACGVGGMAIALTDAPEGMTKWLEGLSRVACAILAWATLILGYTNWPSWWSLARYGGPTAVIAIVAAVGGAPVPACALYAAGGLLVGLLYVVLHKHAPFRYSTAVCEAAAGATIVGGLSWLG